MTEIRINFLPKNYQPPKQLGAKEWAMAVAAALAVVGTAGYYATVYAGTVDMEHQVQADQVQLQNVRTLLAEADDIKAREAKVTKAEHDLKVLAGRHWSGVLLTLSQLTPQNVSWTSLQTSGNDVTLKGTSRELVDVAQLLGGLVTDTSVQQVSLHFVNEKGIPITVTMKANDKGQPTATNGAQPADVVKEMGQIRQLEFELVITLVPAEGRALPNGA